MAGFKPILPFSHYSSIPIFSYFLLHCVIESRRLLFAASLEKDQDLVSPFLGESKIPCVLVHGLDEVQLFDLRFPPSGRSLSS